MEDDRQSRIDWLVHSALALDPEKRASYLAETCADGEVREEVTRTLNILARLSEAGYEPVKIAEPASPDTRIGQTYGNYRVTLRLGAGGMGEVYLAFDTKLGRQVALKFLSGHTAGDETVLRRFQLEARTASALNHPNILTIFDVGKFGKEHYIASEFIEGVTLRNRLRRGRLEIGDALDIMRQVASALVAAHSAGIVHRDLKPTNIMLRPDGYVKVIDFGLAKRTQNPAAPKGEEAYTKPGTMVGTADYMSPEQARGEEVDGRGDIWSLGIILYEMLAGERPFDGHSEYHVIVHILENEPKPLPKEAGIPPEVVQILERSLQKDPRDRYQTAAELYTAVTEARQALDLSGITRKSAVFPARLVSRKWWRIAAASAVLLLLISAVWWRWQGRELLLGPEPFDYSQMKKVTYRGLVQLAAVSPDGRYLSFVSGTPHHEELYIKPIDSSFESALVRTPDTDYTGLSFSSDGQYILYVTRRGEFGKLFKVAITGGEPRLIANDVDGPPEVNPSGDGLAFRRDIRGQQFLVLTGGSSDDKETSIPLGRSPQFSHRMAWAQGGPIAVFGFPESGSQPMLLELVDPRSHQVTGPRPLPGWTATAEATWLRSGHDLIAVAQSADETQDTMQLRAVSAVTGRTRTLTPSLYGYRGASLTADKNQLVTIRLDRQTRFWIAPRADVRSGQVRAADSGQYDSVAWTNDNKLITQANRGDGVKLWLIDPSGAQAPKVLGRDSLLMRDASWIPHRNAIVYAAQVDDVSGVWMLAPDDGKSTLIASAPGYVESPACSPDGNTVVYTAWKPYEPSVWSAPVSKGQSPQLLVRRARHPLISPDGKLLAVELLENDTTSLWEVAIYGLSSRQLVGKFSQLPAGSKLKWSPDGLGLNYIVTDDQGTSNIWLQRLAGGPAQRITDFDDEQIFDYAWSGDGNRLVCLRGRIVSDAFDLIRKRSWLGNLLAF